MSDFVCSYQKLTDLINNDHIDKFESFKQILYGNHGKVHTDQADCSDNSIEMNRKDIFSDHSRGRGNLRPHSDNSYRVNEDKNRAYGQTCYRKNQEETEYSNFDDFEKLSVSFIKLLGKARNEHIKLQKRIEDRRQRYCEVPRSRTQTNFCEFQPNAGFQVNAPGNMVLHSGGDGALQITNQIPEYVNSGRISTSLSEVESILNHQDEVYLDADLSAITPSLLDGSPTNLEAYEDLSSVIETAQTAKPTLKCNSKHTDRERRKKDNHNIIERRRRFNINDKIKELGTLLPLEKGKEYCQDKGSILKASVEYVKRLKKDRERFETFEEKIRQIELSYKKMMSRILKLESMTKIKRFDKTSDAHLKSEHDNLSSETKSQSASLESSNTSPLRKTTSTSSISQCAKRNSKVIEMATSTFDEDDATDDNSMLSFESFSPCSPVCSRIYEGDINK